jgi:hypothetical protein
MTTKPKRFKEMKDLTKGEREVLEKWRTANGCATFDFKNDDIIIHDGGLFAIADEPKRKQNFKVSFKKSEKPITFPNGKKITGSEVIFTKEAGTHIEHNYQVIIWPSELDDTINYLNRLKKVLNNVGIETDRSVKWQKGLYKVWKNGKWIWEKRK